MSYFPSTCPGTQKNISSQSDIFILTLLGSTIHTFMQNINRYLHTPYTHACLPGGAGGGNLGGGPLGGGPGGRPGGGPGGGPGGRPGGGPGGRRRGTGPLRPPGIPGGLKKGGAPKNENTFVVNKKLYMYKFKWSN